jgi:cation diffusion facilitator CzcD-associated flavoprotein CzcO
MSRTETDVVVVGAGPAGLSAAGAMKQRGTSAVLLERDSRIGERWSERYERLCLHTVRRYSGLAHRGMPSDYPRYVPKGRFADYLADYAAHFDLDVRPGHRVERVAQAANGGGWEVETDAGDWYARAVVIATGHYNEPIVPTWPGKDRFGGTLVHSGAYRSGSEYARRSVLVVGIGNSGAEIAADLVEQGATRVAIAVRRPPPIMPRELLGILPVQLLGIALTPLNAPGFVDRIGAVTRRVAVGDLTELGLAKAEWGPFTARRPPVIDVGFLEQLKARRIGVRPAVTDLTADGALFADGREEPFDVVVAATGFRSGLSELLDVPDAVGDDGRPRLRSGGATPHPGLYFIGYEETMRGVLYEINRESKRLALSIESYLANGDGTSTA